MSLLLSKQERVMIWNALWFSNHTYRRRGNVDGAAAVQMVMNSTEHVLGVNKKTFTKEEVDQIVKDVVEASQKATSDVIGHIVNREFKKGYKAGQKAMGEEIYFESNRLNYASTKTKVSIMQYLGQQGVLTTNEVREMFGWAPVEDGDKRLVSLNYVNAKKQDEYQGVGGGETEDE